MRALFIIAFLCCFSASAQIQGGAWFAVKNPGAPGPPSCPDPFPGNPNPQLFTGNALSYCPDEVNAIMCTGQGDGCVVTGGGADQSAVATTGNIYGDYAIRATATTATNGRLQIYHSVINGEVYQWEVAYRVESGAGDRRYKFQEGNPDLSSYSFSNTDWEYAGGEFTANSTRIEFRMYATSESGGNVGDETDWKFYLKQKDD